MKNLDAALHTRGESRFVDDFTHPEGLLFAAPLVSPVAHGRIKVLDTEPARSADGVRGVFTAGDIPGENQVGMIIPDEALLADCIVHYVGQPVALVAAVSEECAREALKQIRLEIEELPAVFDPRQAAARGELIVPSRTFSLGDVGGAWNKCEVIVAGKVESGGQEHVYLETQGALAMHEEEGRIKLFSATQSLTVVQKAVARLLGLPMHKVEVDVLRLGGAFGGKEYQATPWACMAALAAHLLKKPVKIVLHRHDDMRLTGKRHPYSSDFKIGLKDSGEIIAYEVTFYQNAGAAADLSPAIMERTMFHATGSYFIPNVRATAVSCRTNLPPNTAFRGFGAPQAMFVMEAAISRAAKALGLEPAVIQEKNLLKEGDMFPYGMAAENCQARSCWETAGRKYGFAKISQRVKEFNASTRMKKKGLALMPICFGISFTNIALNQAGALVHIYTDGSVSVSTAAVEMGQGVKTKITQVAAQTLSTDIKRVRVESTNTTRVANTSPTAASSAADLNGKAVELACRSLLKRLKAAAAEDLGETEPEKVEIKKEVVFFDGRKTSLTWEKLIPSMYARRINLSAQAHYATPGIYFDKKKEKGSPFFYHVYGTAITEVTLDCLRGTYEVDSVKAVHDCGRSINPLIDRGQAEGGIVQGLGWMILEELQYSEDGRLLTDFLSTYKVPDIYFVPREIEVHFLESSDNPLGILNSKAIGEPPFMYGIGGFFALLRAMEAFRPDLEFVLSAPLTPEKVLLTLYQGEETERPTYKSKERKAFSK